MIIVGSIGRDELGEELLAALTESGLDTSQIVSVEQSSTRSMILVDEQGERTVVNFMRSHEENPPVRLLDIKADCVYVRSRRRDLGSLLKKKAESSLIIAHVPPSEKGSRPAHILVASASDVAGDVLDDPWAVGQRIADDLLQWMIVTHGAEGVIAYAKDQVLRIPAKPVKPIDTTGAGDSFAAGLVHALMSGASMSEALETAATWGAEATQYDSSILPEVAIDQLLQ